MLSISRRCVILGFLTILLLPVAQLITAQEVASTGVSSFNVAFGGRVYDAATDRTTFTYVVTGNGAPPDLSHFDVEIPVCATALSVVAFSPADAVSFGTDPTTGVNGIKWDLPLLTTESRTYTITFTGNVVEGSIATAVKDGNGTHIVTVTGASCAVPAIDVEKFVSIDGGTIWQDADAAPGPDAQAGSQALFRFVITNSGNVELTGITLSDNLLDAIGCTLPAIVAPGASVECQTGPIPVTDGQHTNLVTVNGTYGTVVVTDTDSANYFVGTRPSIHVEKLVSINGGGTWQDADAAPGPEVQLTGQVLFRFIVTNDGNVPLSGVTLTDSAVAISACTIPGTLQPDATFECFAGPLPPTEGQHTNTATATGIYNDATVNATDTANYRGASAPAVINGFTVAYGGRVFINNQTTFTYIVTGNGTPPDLSHFDIEIPVCPVRLKVVATTPTDAVNFGVDPTTGVNGIKWDLPLKVNESRTYTITFEGNVIEGNVLAAVKGGPGFQSVSVTGPSCNVPAIDVEKFVSIDGGATWQDADAAPGPDVPLGTQVSFRFVVTNTGNSDLSGINLSDNRINLSACTLPSTLAASAFFDCVVGPFDVVAGQHSNTATATGSFTGGGLFTSDTDSVHYFGGDRPAVEVKKFISTNGGATWLDADGSGPEVESGTNISFKFIVKNTGNVELSSLVLTDSAYNTGTCTFPATLDKGASFECVIGPFPAEATSHTNTATITASAAGQTVTDTDTAGYRPVEEEPDTPTGPITIIIEGPVDSININIITIYGMEFEIDPNNSILIDLQIGDNVHIEGTTTDVDGRIVIVVVNITIIDIDIIVNPPGGNNGGGGTINVPPGCKITGIGNNNPHLKCSNKDTRKSSKKSD